jgi:hypothetical protein
MRRPAVGIIGVGAAGFKPALPETSTRELMFEAAAAAYRDAGVDPRKEVDSFITTSEDLWEGWSITDEMVPDQLGGAGRPVCTIPGDGITGLGNAVMQIEAGVAQVVALEAHSKASDVLDKEAVENLAQEPSLMRPLGMGGDSLAALEMGVFLGLSGFGVADCDMVIENSRRRAIANPLASFGSKREASRRARRSSRHPSGGRTRPHMPTRRSSSSWPRRHGRGRTTRGGSRSASTASPGAHLSRGSMVAPWPTRSTRAAPSSARPSRRA